MTLILENVDTSILRVIESLQGLNKDLQIEVQDECPICKAHDYTPSKKAAKKLKKSLKEIGKKRKKGTLKSFDSIEELKAELLS
ncbi:hypothetical protein HCN_0041 [Helicobacter cinaedi PAGU611]|uniref:hypothetical protein n=1 Tax=Helicobacter cinaedi TaxID=213 RepID=UPI00025D3296|nr:hypothetical protein [Helicobacter cinaedi]AWK60915.1 hypothetical protein C6B36_00090 [Helicobacter cinaedi]QOQ96688.1 hypothetical protein HW245_03255 [Helicobacter cinaedi]BAM11380.1 hypothetical protein HCN_0041 [Helicobacter cinaedi PAGU611]BBB18871.1 hypothetical protein HC081234_00480 [Helicobacter cinaedi]